ncbi:hypothetical protein J3Q64DRAFT_1710346 [Phycomyces blakesleeanus]|uniref:Uncharacterized protein n=1 Tax=Phycomyces blakesleeanus TaxID=4837 RepID=A0ABR3BF49_PHYBL
MANNWGNQTHNPWSPIRLQRPISVFLSFCLYVPICLFLSISIYLYIYIYIYIYILYLLNVCFSIFIYLFFILLFFKKIYIHIINIKNVNELLEFRMHYLCSVCLVVTIFFVLLNFLTLTLYIATN